MISKEHRIILKRSELVLHIRQICMALSKSASAEAYNAPQEDNRLTDIFQSSGQDTMLNELATREMNKAAHILAFWMRDHIDTKHCNLRVWTDDFHQPEAYEYILNVDCNYGEVEAKVLEDAAHEFLCWKVMMYWVLLNAPEYSDRAAVLLDNAETNLVDALSATAEVEITPYPVW